MVVVTALLVTGVAVGVASVSAVQAQTTASITIDPVGTFDAQTGTATITGTFACGEASGFAVIEVTLRQSVGRVSTVTGQAFAEIPACEPGLTGTWTALVSPSSGEFRGGLARADARLVVEGASIAETGTAIRLRG